MARAFLTRSTVIVAGFFLFGCGGVSTAPDAGGGAGGAAAGSGGRAGTTGAAGRGGSSGAAGSTGGGGVAGTGIAGSGVAGTGIAGSGGATGGSAGSGGATGGAGGLAGAGGRGGSGGTGGSGGSGIAGSGGSAGSGGTAGTGIAGSGGSAGGSAGSGGSAGGTGGSAGSGGSAGGAGGRGGAGGTAGSGGSGTLVPVITATSYAVVAHGLDLTITGSRFTGATALTIGGTAHVPTVASDAQVTVHVSDATPIGAQSIVITNAAGPSLPFGITVIHLVINELDSDQPATDAAEFVEISTGVAGVSLASYTLVFWNGFDDTSYTALNLNTTTNASGLLTAGNPALVAPVTFPDNTLQNGADAVAVYAGTASMFPSGIFVTSTRLIDALVYGSADAADEGLLDNLFGPVGTTGRVQADEAANQSPTTQSIQRCGSGRLRGNQFTLGTPTPNAVNNVPACL